jgi:hypothetical protein
MFLDGGLLDARRERSHAAPLAYFNHPAGRDVQEKLFGVKVRARARDGRNPALKERVEGRTLSLHRKVPDRGADSRKTSSPFRCTCRSGSR